MLSWSDAALEQRMREGWGGGLADGTPCGGGSTKASAHSIVSLLASMAERYCVKSICDAGAGDLHWIVDVPWSLHMVYRAFDIVPRHPNVLRVDITQQALPKCDVILCRHVLIHFDPERIVRTLGLFRMSGRYLLASQYDDAPLFDGALQYNQTDLRPLLGEPLERLSDTGSDLALWKL